MDTQESSARLTWNGEREGRMGLGSPGAAGEGTVGSDQIRECSEPEEPPYEARRGDSDDPQAPEPEQPAGPAGSHGGRRFGSPRATGDASLSTAAAPPAVPPRPEVLIFLLMKSYFPGKGTNFSNTLRQQLLLCFRKGPGKPFVKHFRYFTELLSKL